MRRFFYCVLAFASVLCLPLRAAPPKNPSVVDYFLLLPEDTFDGSPAGWLTFLRQPGCGSIDIPHGYMSCKGDGGQPEFDVALFRYENGHPLLAISSGELEGPDSVFLRFFALGKDGRMHAISRHIFPVPDGRGYHFQLPNVGRTIVVTKGKSSRRFTWNGSRFVEESK